MEKVKYFSLKVNTVDSVDWRVTDTIRHEPYKTKETSFVMGSCLFFKKGIMV